MNNNKKMEIPLLLKIMELNDISLSDLNNFVNSKIEKKDEKVKFKFTPLTEDVNFIIYTDTIDSISELLENESFPENLKKVHLFKCLTELKDFSNKPSLILLSSSPKYLHVKQDENAFIQVENTSMFIKDPTSKKWFVIVKYNKKDHFVDVDNVFIKIRF